MAHWGGGIRIVPASDLRPQNRFINSQTLRTDPQNSGTQQSINPSDVPINSAFYPQYNNGGFVRNYQAHAYTGNTLDRHFPPPQTNTLNPTLRRYQRLRTSPNKALPSNYQKHRPNVAARLGSSTNNGTLDTRYVRSFSGPIKRPAPIYQKRREHFSSTDHYGNIYDPLPNQQNAPWPSPFKYDPYMELQPSQQQLFYVQPQTISTQRKIGKKVRKKEEKQRIEEAYPLAARLGVKLAEFIFGLIILGLVLSPVRGLNLAEFLRKTNTEWQGVVLAGVACLSFVSLLLLLTICCANSRLFWRRIDIINSAVSSFLYLVITCIEAYYAACYPPNGVKIALVCYRIEWIVAAVICFFQIVIYITDMIMSLRTGVSLL